MVGKVFGSFVNSSRLRILLLTLLFGVLLFGLLIWKLSSEFNNVLVFAAIIFAFFATGLYWLASSDKVDPVQANLIGKVPHEFKTPLNGILGFASMM